MRAGQVEKTRQEGVEGREGEIARRARGPEEGFDFAQPQRPRVEGVVVGRYQINICQRDGRRGEGGRVPPTGCIRTQPRRGGRRDGEEVEQVGCYQRREGVVEVCLGIVGGAEGAVGEDGRAELQVEQAGLEGGEFGAEGEVGRGEGVGRAEGAQAGEEDVGGDLEAGLGCFEDVFGGEDGEGSEEEDGCDGGEDGYGVEDGGGEGADLEAVLGAGAERAVVADGFGEEERAEEDEEGLDPVEGG